MKKKKQQNNKIRKPKSKIQKVSYNLTMLPLYPFVKIPSSHLLWFKKQKNPKSKIQNHNQKNHPITRPWSLSFHNNYCIIDFLYPPFRRSHPVPFKHRCDDFLRLLFHLHAARQHLHHIVGHGQSLRCGWESRRRARRMNTLTL